MDISKYKSLIIERRQSLVDANATASLGTATVELDQTKVGRLSRMDAMQMQQMNLETERRRKRELVALDTALQRLQQGDFGFCLQCDEEINPKRLEIDLTATLCIKCASAREKL